MTTALFIFIFIAITLIFILKKDKKNNQNNTISHFFNLDDGNQKDLLIAAEISQDWLNEVKSKYNWDNFDQYDNRMWEYMYKLFDDMVANHGIEDHKELWFKLNRSQKVFWAFLAFNGDTNNGGVYQFMFNKTAHIFSTLEMWQELGMDDIAKDYEAVLHEFTGKVDTIAGIKATFNNEANSWDKRFTAFAEGYKELTTAQKIESYYYKEEFTKYSHKKVSDYIEQHIAMFVKA